CSRRATSSCRRGSWPSGSSPTVCRCGCRFNCTSISGAMNRGADSPARAVVLLSGGLDSATALAWARRQGFEAYALSVGYGQRHQSELQAAARVARAQGAREHRIMHVDLAGIGGSALTDWSIPLPEQASVGIPISYVPARNTLLLALALGWAEVLGARDLVVGVNAVDWSGYPDCRPEFIRSFEALAALATKAGVEGARFQVHAPLIAMSKAEIIRSGLQWGVDYAMTVSCYQADVEGRACGARVSRPRALTIRPATAERSAALCSFRYHARPIFPPFCMAIHGSVAQSVEQRPFKALVVGSSPTRPMFHQRGGTDAVRARG